MSWLRSLLIFWGVVALVLEDSIKLSLKVQDRESRGGEVTLLWKNTKVEGQIHSEGSKEIVVLVKTQYRRLLI